MSYYSVEKVSELLNLSKSQVHYLHNKPKYIRMLGRKFTYKTNPMRYLKSDIDHLVKILKEPDISTRIISILNHKGGVTKSTTTANVGYILASKGFKTLVIDIDFQRNLSLLMKKDINDKLIDYEDRQLYSFLKNIFQAEDIIYQGRHKNLFFIPTTEKIMEIDRDARNPVNIKVFKNMINDLSHFQYILFDTPPSLSRLTDSALFCSTDVLIPMVPDEFSFQALELVRSTITILNMERKDMGELPLNELGVFINRVRISENTSKIALEELNNIAEKLKFPVVDAYISESTDIGKAHLLYKTLYELDSEHKVSKEYEKLVKEVLDV